MKSMNQKKSRKRRYHHREYLPRNPQLRNLPPKNQYQRVRNRSNLHRRMLRWRTKKKKKWKQHLKSNRKLNYLNLNKSNLPRKQLLRNQLRNLLRKKSSRKLLNLLNRKL